MVHPTSRKPSAHTRQAIHEGKMRALTYLQKSPDTGVYRVRRIIPARMRHAFGGRREYLKSLGTREIGRARSLAMPILADLQVQFDRIDGQIIPEGPEEVIREGVRDDGQMVMDAAQEAVSECPERVSDVPHDHQVAVSHATDDGKCFLLNQSILNHEIA